MSSRPTWVRDVIMAVIGAVVGGAITYGVDEYRASPSLKFDQCIASANYVDVFSTSRSSRPFLIHGYIYRVVEVVREPSNQPPDIPEPSPPDRPRIRLFNRPIRATQKMATKAIDPDAIELRPGPVQEGQWIQGMSEPLEVEPYKAERIRVSITDAGRRGAIYRIDAIIAYGNKSDPTTEYVPPFEINVVAEGSSTPR